MANQVNRLFVRDGSDSRRWYLGPKLVRRTPACLLGYVFLVILVPSRSLAGAEPSVSVYGHGTHEFTVATGSPGELGLLESLANAFNRTHDTTVRWRKAGSGESLELLRKKEVDLVLVHAPEAERKAVEQGWAACRTLVAANEFYLVGPKHDPASVATATSVVDAYARIAQDQSNLSFEERQLRHTPEGNGHLGQSRHRAARRVVRSHPRLHAPNVEAGGREASLFHDRQQHLGDCQEWPENLVVLLKGDPLLVNAYHALCQPENATRGQPGARQFLEFVVSDEGQRIVRLFGQDKYGEVLYLDARSARERAE